METSSSHQPLVPLHCGHPTPQQHRSRFDHYSDSPCTLSFCSFLELGVRELTHCVLLGSRRFTRGLRDALSVCAFVCSYSL